MSDSISAGVANLPYTIIYVIRYVVNCHCVFTGHDYTSRAVEEEAKNSNQLQVLCQLLKNILYLKITPFCSRLYCTILTLSLLIRVYQELMSRRRSMKLTLPARCHHNPNQSPISFHIRKVKSRYLKSYMKLCMTSDTWQW